MLSWSLERGKRGLAVIIATLSSCHSTTHLSETADKCLRPSHTCAYTYPNKPACLQNDSAIEMVHNKAEQIYNLITGSRSAQRYKHVHKRDTIRKAHSVSYDVLTCLASFPAARVHLFECLRCFQKQIWKLSTLIFCLTCTLKYWKCRQTAKVINNSPTLATPKGNSKYFCFSGWHRKTIKLIKKLRNENFRLYIVIGK